jgi:hypothetical protein
MRFLLKLAITLPSWVSSKVVVNLAMEQPRHLINRVFGLSVYVI